MRAAAESSARRSRAAKSSPVSLVGTNGLFRTARFALIASAFNRPITQVLVRAAQQTLTQHGVPASGVKVYWVPGAFEMPVVAARLASQIYRPDAIIALGALIRGGTPQYRVIADAVARGLMDVSTRSGIPVTFGVIVARKESQAHERAGGKEGNRGQEAAEAALAVLQTLHPMKPHA